MIAMGQRVGQQVRQDLRDARAVALDRDAEGELGDDDALRMDALQLVDDLQQRHRQRLAGTHDDGDSVAELAAREVQHVVDQLGHPLHARFHSSRDHAHLLVDGMPPEQLQPAGNGGDRIAQVVSQDCHETIAQSGKLRRTAECRLAAVEPLLGIDLHGQQLGEQFQRRQHVAGRQGGRLRIEAADRAEHRSVPAENRHRDVALEPVGLRRRMIAVDRIRARLIDDDGGGKDADLMAERRREVEPAADRNTEPDPVKHRARGPGLTDDAADCGKAKSGRIAQDAQDQGHGAYPLDKRQISFDRGRQILAVCSFVVRQNRSDRMQENLIHPFKRESQRSR